MRRFFAATNLIAFLLMQAVLLYAATCQMALSSGPATQVAVADHVATHGAETGSDSAPADQQCPVNLIGAAACGAGSALPADGADTPAQVLTQLHLQFSTPRTPEILLTFPLLRPPQA